ncbi:MAG: BolA family transcriptional regulator [Rhodobacteraceae bacterium]|nr:BolA family transcriptional regulator [Paracoccaceae bacterium]
MGAYRDRIIQKIVAALQPEALDLFDDSARHAGHAGAHADGGGETHFKLSVEAKAFAGKSRLERQRMVYAILADELKERVHALELKLKAPGET